VRWQVFIGKSDTLRDLAKLDEAEAVLLEATTRFADSEWAAARHAAIAALRRDWSGALLRWDAVRARFPDRPVGYIGRGEVLREMDRLDEADEAFGAAMERFPENEWAAMHYAETANRRGDWTEALRRWEFVTAKFPDHADGYVGLAAALREMGRFDEADAVLGQAVVRFTRNQWVAIGYAQTAVERHDWAKAASRWDLVLQRFPRQPAGHFGKAAALVEAGKLDEAAAILISAAALFPNDPRFSQWTRD
jgi:predicted Zn-dependent protease